MPSATVHWTTPVVGGEPTIKAGQAVAFTTTGPSPTVTERTDGRPAATACTRSSTSTRTPDGGCGDLGIRDTPRRTATIRGCGGVTSVMRRWKSPAADSTP